MKRYLGLSAVLVVVSVLAAPQLFSQEKDKAKPAEAAKAEAKAEAKPRLPDYYGKLELTDEQKARVYEVLAKSRSEIEQLEKALAAAKAKRDSDVAALLTPEQKAKLGEFTAAAKKKAEDAKKAKAAGAKEGATTEKKTETTTETKTEAKPAPKK